MDLTELHALLARPREATGWADLCELVASPPWERTAARWLPVASEVLDRDWADEARVWPEGWTRKKRLPAAIALVRHLAIGWQTAAMRRRLLAHLEALDPDTMPPLRIFSHDGERGARGEMTASDAAMLVERLSWTPLREVRLGGNEIVAPLWEALTRAPAPPAIERLSCMLYCTRLTDGPTAALLASPLARELRDLSMRRSCYSSPACAAQIAAVAPRLEGLCLDQMLGPDSDETRVHEILARADWSSLQSLQLKRPPTSFDAHLDAWLDSAPQLSSLFMSSIRESTPIDDVLCGRLGPPLRRLQLPHSTRTASQLTRVLSSRIASQVQALDIAGAEVDAGTAAALLRLPLEWLDLRHMQGEAFWQALSGARLERLHTLRLGLWRDPESALATAATLDLPALRTLEIDDGPLPEDARRVLERGSWYGQARLVVHRRL